MHYKTVLTHLQPEMCQHHKHQKTITPLQNPRFFVATAMFHFYDQVACGPHSMEVEVQVAAHQIAKA